MKKSKENNTGIFAIVIMFFTVGLILGSVSYFHMPEELLKEVSFIHPEEETFNFLKTMKQNFMVEIFWVMAVWMLNNMSITAPFSGGILALRGFLTGFSVTFIMMYREDKWKLLASNILPQTLIALPILTVFTIKLMRLSMERRDKGINDGGYYIAGAVFSVAVVASSALEALISMLFIKLL